MQARLGAQESAAASRARAEELFGGTGAGASGAQVRARLERISTAPGDTI